MKLKRLVLQGYKTFASKTEFIFDDGITAIVGPNGSGKSNVADALRWVLGEQSYGALRGKRTTDMIFAGSQSRPRAGMAQVMLTLDNSDNWLPIEYTEVEIGRRAYRTGENEYLINGQKVRLKDITDLLATSGLAERTYTIIGQGLIDQALSLRAEERRALFEEAAGINHYKSKRATTLRQLEETQRNLQRVHDILAEIQPRLTSLKRQATRARNYEQVMIDLRHLLRIWYGYKWEQAKEKLRAARETAVSTESIWQESRHRLLVQQENMNDLRQRINHRQQQSQEIQTQRDDIRDQLERARREVAILHERQQALRRQLADIEQELPQLDEQRQRAAAELETATAELTAAQASLQANQLELHQFNSSFQAQQAEINRWQNAVQQAEQQQRTQQNRLAQAEGQLSQLRERLAEMQKAEGKEKKEESEEALAAELAQIAGEIEKATAVLQSAQSRVEELRQKRVDLQEQRQTRIRDLKNLRRDYGEQSRDLTQRQKEVARLETRVEMLDQMRSKTVKVGKDVPILGQFSNFITIPAAHQTAVAAALAARLSTLVLPDSHALWQALKGSQQPLTAAALADVQPPEPMAAPEDTAVIGWASEHISSKEEAAPLAQLLLGRVLLVADDQAAYRLARQLPSGALAAAPGGLIVHAGGLVETGGRHGQNNVLAREQEWRESKNELTKIKDEVAALENMLGQLNEIIQGQQNEVDELQEEERRLGRLENEAGQRVAQAQRSLDNGRQQQNFVQQRQTTNARQAAARQQELTRLAQRVQDAETALVTYRQDVENGETAVLHARDQLNALPINEGKQQRLTLQQSTTAAQTIVAGRQAVVDSRRATLNQVEKQIGRLRERQTTLQTQQGQIDLSHEEQTRKRLQERLDQLEASLQPAREQLTAYRLEMRQLEEEMAAIQRRTLELETHYTQAQVKRSQEESQIEGLQERIKADLGIVTLAYDDDQTGPTPLPMGDFAEELPGVTELPSDIEETIHNYRGQLQRMGAINPDAPEEYESTQERFDFLTQQVEDLNETERQLRDVIAELDDLTSKAFASTVEEVNIIFGRTFEQLFGGGSARLVLTDPDDLTISGVDIIAQLPNRREQGLGLLSGGERSLTAAALIFSLLKVSPTPFCVMDEVDAALDEANVNRFRDLLRELSLKSQFIVITHNRGTVQAAQTIYGISMGTDSASQSLSIKTEEYLKQAPLL
ncbi:MAG: chromosome segregation protein SMC [Chloroflexota bacterium]